MSVPIAETGHPEARQEGPPREHQAEDLGEGHITGNLTEEPELRFTPNGRAVAKVRICYRPRIKDATTNKWQDGEPEFYTVNVWGRQGENTAECFRKGDRVVAVGSWTKRPWTDREGKERVSVELTVRDIGPSLLFKSAEIIRPDESEGTDSDQH